MKVELGVYLGLMTPIVLYLVAKIQIYILMIQDLIEKLQNTDSTLNKYVH
jgi:hypothetical protein